MDGNLIQGIIMVVLLVMSAFFSATETSFSALNRTRLKNMAEKGNKRAEAALKLAENYDSLLSSILVGNNIVNISMASIGTVMFVNLLGSSSGPTVSTIVCTVVVLIFGEITPKSVAKEMPENFAMAVTPVMRVLLVVLKPINAVFSGWKKLLPRVPFRKRPYLLSGRAADAGGRGAAGGRHERGRGRPAEKQHRAV